MAPRPPCPTCGNRVCTCIEDLLAGQMRQAGLPPLEREYRFCPGRQWRFDFAAPLAKVAVECEGGTWSDGAHVRGAGYAEDCEKYNQAAVMGWKVLRFTREMIERGEAWPLIALALNVAVETTGGYQPAAEARTVKYPVH